MKRYPDFDDAQVSLGRADLELHRPEEAVAALQRATQLRPDDDVAWYRLSQAQRAVGNRQGQAEALAEFRKIHQTIPVTLQRSHAGETITPQALDSEAKE